MKKFLILFAAIVFMGNHSLSAQDKKKDAPAITFEKETMDLGKIEKGQVAKCQFKFKNNGTTPLTLVNVRPSCGCTTPSFSKEPVMPGKFGFIEAAYNSSNASIGSITKSITVTTNIPDQSFVIFIKGEVVNPSPVRINPE